MEDWASIRNIKAKNPKLGTRKIAALLGISRNTVKRALKSDEAPVYNRGVTKINEHIAPFEGFIKEAVSKETPQSFPNTQRYTIQRLSRKPICSLCLYT